MKPDENEITIDRILESFAAELERGQRPSIEEYKQKYPEFAERIQAIFPALVALENVDSDPSIRKLVVDDSIPEILGEYKIIQEVGRGGMGVVFEAEHTTMRRKVALKVLPKSGAAKPNHLSRFLAEARSAGQLHHTNIVPVFEVGQSDGLHFYAMQFIHGDNLDRVIDDVRKLRKISQRGPAADNSVLQRQASNHHANLSHSIACELIESTGRQDESIDNGVPHDPAGKQREPSQSVSPTSSTDSAERLSDSVFRPSHTGAVARNRNLYHYRVAAVGIQIADALNFAHSHGVLHRDVKPANLILDTGGNVWVTDFGLAKHDEHDLTQTGDIVGTLRYMAPERFAGQADRRSDIYSLGLTLYELCTLRCAFDNDRGTLMRDVVSRSAVVHPRIHDETIPADLETIVLKAIEPQPQRRYQSAKELADDLRLFVADRPIMARRASWIEKCWRICRRNPVASVMASCLLLLLVIIAAGSLQYARNETKSRKESQFNLYLSKLDQARMRRFSGQQGQRYEALKALGESARLLPRLDFSIDRVAKARVAIRNEAIAAMSLTDLNPDWSCVPESGWADQNRMAIDEQAIHYAVGHTDGRIRVHRIDNHEVVMELPSPTNRNEPPWAIKFSPDGRYLVSDYHLPTAELQNTLTVVWHLQDQGRQVWSGTKAIDRSFSADRDLIAVSFSDRVELIQLPTGELIKTLVPHFANVGSPRRLAFDASGKQLAVSQSAHGIVEFWDISNQPQIVRRLEISQNVYEMDWDSKRELFVIGGHEGTLYYWRGSLDAKPGELKLHQNTIYRLHIHPVHELVATSAWDSTSRLTDLLSGEEVLCMERKITTYNGFLNDGRLALTSDDDQPGLEIWNVAEPLIDVYSVAGKKSLNVTFHPVFSQVVAHAVEDAVEFRDCVRKTVLGTLPGIHASQLMFTNNGRHLYVGGNQGLRRWNLRIEETDGKLELHANTPIDLVTEPVTGLDLASSLNLIVVAVGENVLLIDPESGNTLKQFGPHKGLSRIQVTADDQYLLTGTWHGYGVKIWDMQTGDHLYTVESDVQNSRPIAHLNDPGIFYAGWKEGRQYRLTQSGPKLIGQIRTRKFDGLIRMSSDGKALVVKNSSFNTRFLHPATGEPIAEVVAAGRSRIVELAMSHDARWLALACFDNLQIIDLSQLRAELATLDMDW